VNAAYLMLTTAWLAGADPVPAAAAPAPAAPVVSTSMGSCNGSYTGGWNGCNGGVAADNCGCERQRLCDRLKGLFSHCHNRQRDCGCEAAPAPVVKYHAPAACCAPAPAPAPVSTGCDDQCKKPGLCARLKALCHRNRHNDCGCEGGAGYGGCNGYGSNWGCGGATGYPGGVITTPGTAEPIPAQPKPGEAPKPMPKTTPMTMNGVISNVTPVAAPASPF
jgi:hypothetical protein